MCPTEIQQFLIKGTEGAAVLESIMDTTSLAQGIVAAATAKTQQAAAVSMMKMNVKSNQAIADLLQAAQENVQQLAQAANPPGVGGGLDITA